MLKSIRVQNIQSHKDTMIEFSSGITAITGPTGSGKSALLLRPLKWIMQNRPLGDGIRSNWGGKSVAALETAEGEVLYREKTKTTNRYRINENAPLNAVKASVPEEVSNIINMNAVNLQQQHDRPFLLDESWSAGKVAKHFNEVANISAIDTSTTNVKSWISGIKSRIKGQEDSLKNLIKERKKYKYLHGLEQKVKVLATLVRQRNVLSRDNDRLSSLITDIREVRRQLKEYKNLEPLKVSIDHVLDLTEKRKSVSTKYMQLNNLISDIRRTRADIKSVASELEDLNNTFEDEFPDTCPLCGK